MKQAGSESMRLRKGWVAIALVIAAAAAYAAIERPWEARQATVATETLAPGPVTQVLAINGRIAALKSVTVRAAVSAQAMAFYADEGERVAADKVLVTLDTALADAQVEQAKAALEAQQARQRQAQGALGRARALGSIGPRADLEDAALALEGAQQDTVRFQAALDQAEKQVAQYTIKAPISGVVLARGVDQGQMVDPQTELFVIADMSALVVETDIDELYSAHVREGLRALLRPIGSSVARGGKVVFAAPTVDSATGGRKIKIAFDDAVDLPVGLTVNVNVIVKEVDRALSLPRSAIVTEGAQSHVVVIANGVAERRDICFDDWPSERVIVTEGLYAGDIVILEPAAVKPGEKVSAE